VGLNGTTHDTVEGNIDAGGGWLEGREFCRPSSIDFTYARQPHTRQRQTVKFLLHLAGIISS